MDDEEDLYWRLVMHFDPDGSLAQHIRSSMSMIGSDDHSFLNLIAKIALYPIYGPTWEADRLFKDIVEFVRLFTPHGWAPVKRGSVELIRSGLDTYHISGSLDQAERVLVDGWNEGNRIHTALLPLQMLGARDERKWAHSKERWSHVERALVHHQDAAYEASIPIVFHQIDGIVQDFAKNGVTLFDGSKHYIKYFQDDSSLLGFPEISGPLRRKYGETVHQTGVEGKLSRHGILHGRELGYGTLANSTKVFVLLAAIVEWGVSQASRIFEEEQQKRDQRYAGSDELDSSCRRMDRRGFAEAKKQLGIVDMLQTAHWSKHGYYAPDMSRLASSISLSMQSINAPQIELRTNQVGTTYWAWTATPSGYTFGTAGKSDTRGVWYYAGKEEPTGDPDEDRWWRHVMTDPAHPDW